MRPNRSLALDGPSDFQVLARNAVRPNRSMLIRKAILEWVLARNAVRPNRSSIGGVPVSALVLARNAVRPNRSRRDLHRRPEGVLARNAVRPNRSTPAAKERALGVLARNAVRPIGPPNTGSLGKPIPADRLCIGALRDVLGRGNPERSGWVPTGTAPILDLWSGSLWRMSRFSELKVTGTGFARFSNSPIARVKEAACGGAPQAMASRGEP